jgi:hypothetical protein
VFILHSCVVSYAHIVAIRSVIDSLSLSFANSGGYSIHPSYTLCFASEQLFVLPRALKMVSVAEFLDEHDGWMLVYFLSSGFLTLILIPDFDSQFREAGKRHPYSSYTPSGMEKAERLSIALNTHRTSRFHELHVSKTILQQFKLSCCLCYEQHLGDRPSPVHPDPSQLPHQWRRFTLRFQV